MKMDKSLMARAFPERPARFDGAIDRALDAIHAEAAGNADAGRADAARCANAGRADTARRRRTGMRGMMWRRPALAWTLAAVLLLAGTLGVAEGMRRGVFGFLWGEEDVLPEAAKLVREDVASLSIGNTELIVTESAYDGATLRLVLSVRAAEFEDVPTHAQIESESSAYRQALASDGVTALYSFDRFRVNGEEYAMTGGSGGETVPGEQGGETLMYFELNLLGIDVPQGDVTFELPVARDAQGETLWLSIPAKAAELASVRDVTPQETIALDNGGTLTVVSARLSPIAAYATIRLDFPEGAEDAASEAFANWQHFTFADENGKSVCPYTELTGWGLPQGETDPALHFEVSIRCKASETYPDDLFLACEGASGGNMVPLQ